MTEQIQQKPDLPANLQVDQPSDVDAPTFCAVHPTIETALRCNRCGRYMCTRCAVPTDVGYRCRQCVYRQQDVFYKATQTDYLLGVAVAFGMSLPLGWIVPRLFLLGVLLLSLPAGALIGEAVFRATGRRRGRYLPQVVAVAVIAGTLLVNLSLVQAVLQALDAGASTGLLVSGLAAPVLYLVLCVLGAIGRLR